MLYILCKTFYYDHFQIHNIVRLLYASPCLINYKYFTKDWYAFRHNKIHAEEMAMSQANQKEQDKKKGEPGTTAGIATKSSVILAHLFSLCGLPSELGRLEIGLIK